MVTLGCDNGKVPIESVSACIVSPSCDTGEVVAASASVGSILPHSGDSVGQCTGGRASNTSNDRLSDQEP